MKEDIIGKRFGKLVITAVRGTAERGHRIVECKCDCGEVITVHLNILKRAYNNSLRKHTEDLLELSCGCTNNVCGEATKEWLYQEWYSMLHRCLYASDKSRAGKHYKNNGVTVCDEWKHSYNSFKKWAIDNGWTDENINDIKNKLTIDRIDSAKGYSPLNCKWSTYSEQVSHLKDLKTNKTGVHGVAYVPYQSEIKPYVVVVSINNKSHRVGNFATIKEAAEERNKFILENHLEKSHKLSIID